MILPSRLLFLEELEQTLQMVSESVYMIYVLECVCLPFLSMFSVMSMCYSICWLEPVCFMVVLVARCKEWDEVLLCGVLLKPNHAVSEIEKTTKETKKDPALFMDG